MVKSFDRQEVYLMYKAVVSDLDGTLLNGSHEIDDFTKEIVLAVRNKILYSDGKKLFRGKSHNGQVRSENTSDNFQWSKDNG